MTDKNIPSLGVIFKKLKLSRQTHEPDRTLQIKLKIIKRAGMIVNINRVRFFRNRAQSLREGFGREISVDSLHHPRDAQRRQTERKNRPIKQGARFARLPPGPTVG